MTKYREQPVRDGLKFNSEKLCSCSELQGFLLQTHQLKITKRKAWTDRPISEQLWAICAVGPRNGKDEFKSGQKRRDRQRRGRINAVVVTLPTARPPLAAAVPPRVTRGMRKALKELQKSSASGAGVKRIQPYHAAFKATSRWIISGWRTGNGGRLPIYSDVQSWLVSSFLKLQQSAKTDFLHDQATFLIDSVNKILSGNISLYPKAVNYPYDTAFRFLLHFLFSFL